MLLKRWLIFFGCDFACTVRMCALWFRSCVNVLPQKSHLNCFSLCCTRGCGLLLGPWLCPLCCCCCFVALSSFWDNNFEAFRLNFGDASKSPSNSICCFFESLPLSFHLSNISALSLLKAGLNAELELPKAVVCACCPKPVAPNPVGAADWGVLNKPPVEAAGCPKAEVAGAPKELVELVALKVEVWVVFLKPPNPSCGLNAELELPKAVVCACCPKPVAPNPVGAADWGVPNRPENQGQLL